MSDPRYIDITLLFTNPDYCPRDYSASAAELGQGAGRITWAAALDDSGDPPLLTSPDALDAMREFAKSSGGWTREEINAWPEGQVQALFFQWCAGDIREMFPGRLTLEGLTDAEWAAAEDMQQRGSISSNIYRGDDSRVYFYLGS
jgi:hypothetical protein